MTSFKIFRCNNIFNYICKNRNIYIYTYIYLESEFQAIAAETVEMYHYLDTKGENTIKPFSNDEKTDKKYGKQKCLMCSKDHAICIYDTFKEMDVTQK